MYKTQNCDCEKKVWSEKSSDCLFEGETIETKIILLKKRMQTKSQNCKKKVCSKSQFWLSISQFLLFYLKWGLWGFHRKSCVWSRNSERIWHQFSAGSLEQFFHAAFQWQARGPPKISVPTLLYITPDPWERHVSSVCVVDPAVTLGIGAIRFGLMRNSIAAFLLLLYSKIEELQLCYDEVSSVAKFSMSMEFEQIKVHEDGWNLVSVTSRVWQIKTDMLSKARFRLHCYSSVL